jgi:hypothetical protein
MKKLTLTLIAFSFGLSVFAQKKEEEEASGFKWNNVFLGGSVALGYGAGGYDGSSSFVIGANPEIGYTLAEWVDAGLAFNAIFNSLKYTDQATYLRVKQTSFNYGVGVFTRIHPFRSFFIQAQPEYNWISYKASLIDQPGVPAQKQTLTAGSILVGAGYGSREIGDVNFFTVIMFDLGTEKYSPYKDGYGRSVPVIRGGINFYLGKGKKK